MRREILAGLSTFFTISYFFLLFPQILNEGGFDLGASLTATILALVIATLFLGFFADFPAVLAPSIALGAYIIYSGILEQGLSRPNALGVVFWAGFVILLLSLFKVRQKLIQHLPRSIISSTVGGIGLFLICVALKTLSILQTVGMTPFKIGPIATLPNAIALLGLLLFFILHYFQIKASFLISILSNWALSLLLGLSKWNGVAAFPPPLSPFELNLFTPLTPSMWGIVFSVVLISLFDSTASLTALAKLGSLSDENGKIKNIDRVVIADGLGSMVASILGTTSLSFLLESSSGIKAGGRTGITAITAAVCSSACLFLYPLVSSIPPFASTPALIAIGLFMTLTAKEIPWRNWTEAIPALLTLIAIPYTFSIYKGFSLGFLSFVFFKIIAGQWKKIAPICWGLALILILHISYTLFG